MNQNFSSSQVYGAINDTANIFFQNMIGSVYRNVKEGVVVSENYHVSGIQINFILREFMKPDGTLILPQSQNNQEFLNAGSYFGIVEVTVPNEDKFSIQAPHNKPENQVHLQRGREKIILSSSVNSINNYGALGSALFLKFNTKGKVVENIQTIREKYN